jgi:hypothetical protein
MQTIKTVIEKEFDAQGKLIKHTEKTTIEETKQNNIWDDLKRQNPYIPNHPYYPQNPYEPWAKSGDALWLYVPSVTY